MQTSILKMITSQTTEYYIIPEVSKLLGAPSPEDQLVLYVLRDIVLYEIHIYFELYMGAT
jgi:hypothetical protein